MAEFTSEFDRCIFFNFSFRMYTTSIATRESLACSQTLLILNLLSPNYHTPLPTTKLHPHAFSARLQPSSFNLTSPLNPKHRPTSNRNRNPTTPLSQTQTRRPSRKIHRKLRNLTRINLHPTPPGPKPDSPSNRIPRSHHNPTSTRTSTSTPTRYIPPINLARGMNIHTTPKRQAYESRPVVPAVRVPREGVGPGVEAGGGEAGFVDVRERSGDAGVGGAEEV